jgi:hypothetical protein
VASGHQRHRQGEATAATPATADAHGDPLAHARAVIIVSQDPDVGGREVWRRQQEQGAERDRNPHALSTDPGPCEVRQALASSATAARTFAAVSEA